MPQQVSSLDLARLSLSYGEAASLQVPVRPGPIHLGGQSYETDPQVVDARLDVSQTRSGYALRLRFTVDLHGPCHRCLDDAAVDIEVDAREVEQPGAVDEELSSPYVNADGELDVAAWARDALALTLPAQITCTPECAGLCPQCGANLNEDPDHGHEAPPDPRWSKLSEIRFE